MPESFQPTFSDSSAPRLKLTDFETDWIDWALDAVEGYFEEEYNNGELARIPEMATLQGNVLYSSEPEVIDDFLDRIRNLAPDIVGDEFEHDPPAAKPHYRKLDRLADKLAKFRASIPSKEGIFTEEYQDAMRNAMTPKHIKVEGRLYRRAEDVSYDRFLVTLVDTYYDSKGGSDDTVVQFNKPHDSIESIVEEFSEWDFAEGGYGKWYLGDELDTFESVEGTHSYGDWSQAVLTVLYHDGTSITADESQQILDGLNARPGVKR